MRRFSVALFAFILVAAMQATGQTVDRPLKSIEGLTPPRLILQVNPKFSKKLQKSKRHYSVTVHFVLDEKGVPVNATIVPENNQADNLPEIEEVNQNALEAVRQYRFTPAMRGTEPVAFEMNIVVNFTPLSN